LRNFLFRSSPSCCRYVPWCRMPSPTAFPACHGGRCRSSCGMVELFESVLGRGRRALRRLRSGGLCWDVSTGIYLSFLLDFSATSLGRCSQRRGTLRRRLEVHVQRFTIHEPRCL
jgi:hypothetical protein